MVNRTPAGELVGKGRFDRVRPPKSVGGHFVFGDVRAVGSAFARVRRRSSDGVVARVSRSCAASALGAYLPMLPQVEMAR